MRDDTDSLYDDIAADLRTRRDLTMRAAQGGYDRDLARLMLARRRGDLAAMQALRARVDLQLRRLVQASQSGASKSQ